MKNIDYWFNNLKKKYFIKRKLISLSKMKDWKFNNNSIAHKNKKPIEKLISQGATEVYSLSDLGNYNNVIINKKQSHLSAVFSNTL